MSHTDTPWTIVYDEPSEWSPEPSINTLVGPDGQVIRLTGVALSNGRNPDTDIPAGNIAFVATVVNAHDALVEALSEVNDWIKNWAPTFIYDDEWDETYAKIEAALKLARQP